MFLKKKKHEKEKFEEPKQNEKILTQMDFLSTLKIVLHCFLFDSVLDFDYRFHKVNFMIILFIEKRKEI